MPHPFNKLKFDEDASSWTGKIKLASLRDCYGKWYVHWSEIDGPYPDSRKPGEKGVGQLDVIDSKRSGVSESQRAAMDYLLANEKRVTDNLVSFFLKQAKATYFSESLPPVEDCDAKTAKIRERFETVEGIRELFQFVGLTVTARQRTGCAYTVFSLTSPLDDEHGFTIAILKDKPKSWAGLGELGGL